MIWQKTQTIATVILIVLNILNFLLFYRRFDVFKWIIRLSLPALIVILILPKFLEWLTKKKQQRKEKRITSEYLEKMNELVISFIDLIRPDSLDAIPQLSTNILKELDRDSEIYYGYNHVYNLFCHRLESIKSYKSSADSLRNAIDIFNNTIDVYFQLYIDHADKYLFKEGVTISDNWKHSYNATMSKLERLIQEFGDLCKKAKKDFDNMPSYGNFIIRKL